MGLFCWQLFLMKHRKDVMAETKPKTLQEKLLLIQEKLKAEKGQYNSFGKYKYRSCEDILKAVKPLLKETATTLTLRDELQYIGERYYIKATACLSNGEQSIETTAYAREEETKKGMDGSQITGTASSYSRKYALCGLFAIDDGIDSDKTNTGSKTTAQKPIATEQDKVDFAEKDKAIKEATTADEVREIFMTIPKPLQKYFEEKCKKRVEEIEGAR